MAYEVGDDESEFTVKYSDLKSEQKLHRVAFLWQKAFKRGLKPNPIILLQGRIPSGKLGQVVTDTIENLKSLVQYLSKKIEYEQHTSK